jgi:uncharacterized damage-inducible protein DinB
MSLGTKKKLWLDRYQRLKKIRVAMFKELSKPYIEEEWITTRPTKHQWAVDEIIRHIIHSEVRYVQQSFDPTRNSHPVGVRTQWQDDTIIKLDESPHIGLSDLKKLFPPVEVVTEELLREAADLDYERTVKTTWGEKMKVIKLLDYWYEHEHYHRGQIFWVITYFKGPPKDT